MRNSEPIFIVVNELKGEIIGEIIDRTDGISVFVDLKKTEIK
ncbi:hypothetical protein [Xenorhabdus szentirmaii]|nr:hypothetical protein [Xenorhabdus sp. M]